MGNNSKSFNGIKILFSSLFIFISFFMWYFFSQEKAELEIENIKKESYIINLEKTKTKLEIINPNRNVMIKLNWEEMKTKEIDL